MSTNARKIGRIAVAAIASAALALGLSACAPAENNTAGELETITAGKLTIGTGLPAYYPWVVDDNPESGEGFEIGRAHV